MMTGGDRKRAMAQLEGHEGRRNKLYEDSLGILTIGIGRNIEEKGLSDDEVDYLFNNDFKEAESEVLSQRWARDHDGVRTAVLINMCFNLGMTRLRGFKRMIAALQKNDYEVAADEMIDSLWAEQVGYRARELAQMMRTGEWP